MDKTMQWETDRLDIRFARYDDIKLIMQWENDPQNRDFVWQGTLEEHIKEINHPDYALLIFSDKASHTTIGYSLIWINRHSNWAELRRLVVSEKGKGYGKEALSAVMEFLFRVIKVNKVWLDVYPINRVAIQLYERIGMKRDGVLRENFYSDTLGYLDQIVYSILMSEYDNREVTK